MGVSEEVTYYPEFGKVLPDERLRMPTSGRAADGELWDGDVEIAPDDPRYFEWLERVQRGAQELTD